MTMLKVNVIIPAYNAQDYIRDSVESVLLQTYDNVEIIVINDGSTDKTPEILASFGKKIRVIHQENKGLSEARNAGIQAANGQLIAFLDSDDLWLTEKIEKQAALFTKDPQLGFAYTGISIFGQGAGKDFKDIKPKFYRGHVLRELFCYPFITVSSAMVKKICLDEVGLFDPENPSTQDYDLWMRLAERYRVDFIDEPLVRYRVHDSAMSRNRVFMLNWTLHVIEKQLCRTPRVFRDFPSRIFFTTKNLFLRAMILLIYRYLNLKDRETARNMLRKYLSIYWSKIPALLFNWFREI